MGDFRRSVHFTSSFDGVRLTYAICGRGYPLVRVPTWISHVEQRVSHLVLCGGFCRGRLWRIEQERLQKSRTAMSGLAGSVDDRAASARIARRSAAVVIGRRLFRVT